MITHHKKGDGSSPELLPTDRFPGSMPLLTGRVPIIYSRCYDLSFDGINARYPFEPKRRSRTFAEIRSRLGLAPTQFFAPRPVSYSVLRSVHSAAYLRSLRRPDTIARVMGIPELAGISILDLERRILRPLRYATGGTLLGVELALKHGWAVNLSGGFHHAQRSRGGGFCFFADIPLAVAKIKRLKSASRILIVDLDAHHGDGNALALSGNSAVTILDLYNAAAFPYDKSSASHVVFNHPMSPGTGDSTYLPLLERVLDQAITGVRPHFIIYNAGTDVHISDRLGGLKLSDDGLLCRDRIVFDAALRQAIPVLMLLSGAYSAESPQLIGRSVSQLVLRANATQGS